jgi:hypothetical protein
MLGQGERLLAPLLGLVRIPNPVLHGVLDPDGHRRHCILLAHHAGGLEDPPCLS